LRQLQSALLIPLTMAIIILPAITTTAVMIIPGLQMGIITVATAMAMAAIATILPAAMIETIIPMTGFTM